MEKRFQRLVVQRTALRQELLNNLLVVVDREKLTKTVYGIVVISK